MGADIPGRYRDGLTWEQSLWWGTGLASAGGEAGLGGGLVWSLLYPQPLACCPKPILGEKLPSEGRWGRGLAAWEGVT